MNISPHVTIIFSGIEVMVVMGEEYPIVDHF
jgi:hypothetical protein